MKNILVILCLLGNLLPEAKSQTIPIGHWQNHFSNLSARQVLAVNNHIFYSTYNGFFSLDTTTQEVESWSKAQGLGDNGVSAFAFDPKNHLLLLAYRSGYIDFVYLDENTAPAEIEGWSVLAETSGITESKVVRKILFRDQLAYLCTDFGIIVLDTEMRQVKESYRYIGAGGIQAAVRDLAFSEDSLFAVTREGLLATSMLPSVNRQYFANWKLVPDSKDAVSVSVFNKKLFAGFARKGIYQLTNGNWQLAFASQSEYININSSDNELLATTSGEIISIDARNNVAVKADPLFKALASTIRTSGRFWVADGKAGLITNAGPNFQPVTPARTDTTINASLDSIVIDGLGTSWARIPDYQGGGILVKNTAGQQKILSTSIGSGSLPSNLINSLVLDYDGNIWFASDNGAGYFVPDVALDGSRIDAILPIYGQRRLFSNEKCTAIAVEPGNRKWIATRNGLYHFSPDGTELLTMFNTENSPLPSTQINALRFDPAQGLLFVDTSNGMVSYRSDASEPSEDLNQVTIFPNPVRPGFGGRVGFKGLMDGSTVKVTELSGRLIFETRSQGGTASWNLADYNGKRARGGIYMVFIVSGDGSEKLAGKLAVIN
ncbi:PorZ beta-propeller-like domain-containing protein [Dyadobacter crusticola]|uniref:PorZ beta-propeller-like domain-containing protein n=1 Tax=Dyadobacter crusticola TaxID=292407 RepID=UPI0004E14B82|nr:two-component regulator propeller domain-containing protein [Dyadobacter crusticola]